MELQAIDSSHFQRHVDLVFTGIHHDPDTGDKTRQRLDDLPRTGEINMSFACRVKHESQGIGSRLDGMLSVLDPCDTADFDSGDQCMRGENYFVGEDGSPAADSAAISGAK